MSIIFYSTIYRKKKNILCTQKVEVFPSNLQPQSLIIFFIAITGTLKCCIINVEYIIYLYNIHIYDDETFE